MPTRDAREIYEVNEVAVLEVFYALYKEQTIHEILYTLMASSIVNGIGKIGEQRFEVETAFFPKKVRHFLRMIEINDGNRITWDDINNLKEYFLTECTKCGFVLRIPLIGHVKSPKFLLKMRRNRYLVDERIRLYIEKKDLNYLDEIDERIKSIRFSFPESDSFGSFYKDLNDMYSAAGRIKSGNIRKYDKYYSVSGKQIPIK